jgi:hypothetical protein
MLSRLYFPADLPDPNTSPKANFGDPAGQAATWLKSVELATRRQQVSLAAPHRYIPRRRKN